ncbi:MAG: EF-hand domain-containing protein, partial [Planctomycetota bacterium]
GGRFAEMDTNNDGVISSEEAERALGHRAKESDFGLLDRYDADGDGKITREEFTGPGKMFDRLDKNGDGVIDRRDQPDKKGPDRKKKPKVD